MSEQNKQSRRGEIKRILEENKDAILEGYRNGESTCALGRKFNVSNASIFLALRDKWNEPIRETKKADKNRDKILEMHEAGVAAYTIAKELGLGKNTAGRVIKAEGHDISHRQKVCPTDLTNRKDEICERYKAGESSVEISHDLNCATTTVLNLLEDRGVPKRNLRDYSYSVNQEFFKTIDTEKKAYFLGLLMADGYNNQKMGIVSLSLADRVLVEEYGKAIEWTGPISTTNRQAKGHKDLYNLKVGSRIFSDYAAAAGIHNRKSYSATFPSNKIVPEPLKNHLVRGWLDGDGTIVKKSDGPYYCCRIVGTQEVCEGLWDTCNRLANCNGSCYPLRSKYEVNMIIWGYTVSPNQGLANLFRWLYKDATVWLPRKREKAEAFLAQEALRTKPRPEFTPRYFRDGNEYLESVAESVSC